MKRNKSIEIKADCQIACSLETGVFRKKKSTVIVSLLSKTTHIEEIEEGLALEFNYSSEIILELAAFIKVEKECCPFLNYKISIPASAESIKFTLTGPEGTKDFIKYELEMA